MTTYRPTQGLPPGVDEWGEKVTDAAEIERLVVLAGLDGCVTRLHAVRQAKAALSRLDAESLRNALAARRRVLGESR